MDGWTFDSKKEAARYLVLREELKAGRISFLRLQVPFYLRVNGQLICRYEADFVYLRGGVRVVEDVKGKRTDVYKLKKKLMKAIHNIDILET